MGEFAPTFLFVVPSANSYPSTGTTDALTAGQFGFYLPDYTVATAGNVANAAYIYAVQGNPVSDMPGQGSVKSDKLYAKNIVNWYKVTSTASVVNQIIDITDFSAQCSEDVTISLRLRSFYINTGFFNGMTRSYTITTPCCDCGDNPCSDVDEEDLIDQFVTKINDDILVNQFIIAEKLSSGGNFYLRLNGKAIEPDPERCDPTAFPYQYDQLKFWAWAYRGPETTQDYNVWDNCDPFATVETVQEYSYPRGSAAEITQMEKNWYSNRVPPIAKRLFVNTNYNNGYESLVEAGVYYDTYYLEFKSPVNNAWGNADLQDYRVILAVANGHTATIEGVLTAFLGNPTSETGTNFTSTTTTSTTTTTV